MAEIETTEFRGDGTTEKIRTVRAPKIRIEYPDGTIIEVSDLPDDCESVSNRDDTLPAMIQRGKFWGLPDWRYSIVVQEK